MIQVESIAVMYESLSKDHIKQFENWKTKMIRNKFFNFILNKSYFDFKSIASENSWNNWKH